MCARANAGELCLFVALMRRSFGMDSNGSEWVDAIQSLERIWALVNALVSPSTTRAFPCKYFVAYATDDADDRVTKTLILLSLSVPLFLPLIQCRGQAHYGCCLVRCSLARVLVCLWALFLNRLGEPSNQWMPLDTTNCPLSLSLSRAQSVRL